MSINQYELLAEPGTIWEQVNYPQNSKYELMALNQNGDDTVVMIKEINAWGNHVNEPFSYPKDSFFSKLRPVKPEEELLMFRLKALVTYLLRIEDAKEEIEKMLLDLEI